jgi:hypothetical protein
MADLAEITVQILEEPVRPSYHILAAANRGIASQISLAKTKERVWQHKAKVAKEKEQKRSYAKAHSQDVFFGNLRRKYLRPQARALNLATVFFHDKAYLQAEGKMEDAVLVRNCVAYPNWGHVFENVVMYSNARGSEELTALLIRFLDWMPAEEREGWQGVLRLYAM